MVEERLAARESRVEDLDVEALLPQVRTEVQDAQRRIGLHDLHLFGVLVEEVAVRKQQVWH